jgi:17beta-estradiol 17-dehydrogenase / very-long-chain 3-oxoacyl-CoA reductase
MSCYSFIGALAVAGVLYKFLSSLWIVLYPHVLAKRLGHLIDLKKLGKWAVITGATDGIGKAYAKELAKRGLNVFLISRNEERLKATADEIRESSPTVEVKTLAIDYAKANAAVFQKTIREALKDLEIGVLINNVGMSYPYPEEFLKIRGGGEEFNQDMVSVNCLSAVQMIQSILPAMVARQKGAVVNISSSLGLHPAPYITVYSACKAFVDFISRGLRSEYADSGVIIQVVYPFFVATKMSGATTKNKSFLIAEPNEFASAALDTVGIVDMTCGCLSHELEGVVLNLLPSFLVTVILKKNLKAMRDKWLRREQRDPQQKKEE